MRAAKMAALTHLSLSHMYEYLKSLADDESVSVYESMSGEFLKHGQTIEENPEAQTVTLDNVRQIRAFREIMMTRREVQSTLAPA